MLARASEGGEAFLRHSLGIPAVGHSRGREGEAGRGDEAQTGCKITVGGRRWGKVLGVAGGLNCQGFLLLYLLVFKP